MYYCVMENSKNTEQTKGQNTKNRILREGVQLASVIGLTNISIGNLATKLEMSRSGLFAHFLSKEQLQIEILYYAFDVFSEAIMNPCRAKSSPLEKLYFLRDELPNWFEKSNPVLPGGCIFGIACLEFDDRPGKVRDILVEEICQFSGFLKKIYNQAVEAGEFKAECKADYFAYSIYCLYLGSLNYQKLLTDDNAVDYFKKSMTLIIDNCRVQSH